ncbi:hypothetical protein W02_04420 [Nitrospira sp. KM1]|uniref:hypothetical protein n=1 Tax=Nitrospira sp. KM1 TaxID=1936990 RepID=UPI0013A72D85|nr:hypothetical protein [Nitrospira sp. KM1]BCA53302.1 hypothetical protein W02_04420 [Nitrospira sp. KM1]
MDAEEQVIQRAISMIAQSDPIVKLLQQVRQGKMKPTDAGLKAITESWLSTYKKVIQEQPLTGTALKRIDPTPRLDLIIQAGIISGDHPAVSALQESFRQVSKLPS